MLNIDQLNTKLARVKKQLLNHPVYSTLKNEHDLAIFMEHHVYAVWDFMSLLKALQAKINTVKSPWVPEYPAKIRRFINEIVLEEETDVTPNGDYISHFELYKNSMKEAGCNLSHIESLIDQVKKGTPVQDAINHLPIAAQVKDFCLFTFKVIEGGKLHEIASAFTFGREDLIPDMFRQLVDDLQQKFPDRYSTLIYYLDRHIELDGDHHGPLSQQLIASLCKEEAIKWEEATQVAIEALEHRIALWDSVIERIHLAKTVD